jgi:hypothetical protein
MYLLPSFIDFKIYVKYIFLPCPAIAGYQLSYNGAKKDIFD